jgi:hypothetical protein
MQQRLLCPENSAITPPRGEPDCSFSYAMFLSGWISLRHVTQPVHYVGRVEGSRGTLRYVPDTGQVRPMDHGIKAPQSAEASTLASAPAVRSCRQVRVRGLAAPPGYEWGP